MDKKEKYAKGCADNFVELFGEVKGTDYDCQYISYDMCVECSIIMAEKLAELEDHCNFNDPKRKSFFHLVVG